MIIQVDCHIDEQKFSYQADVIMSF